MLVQIPAVISCSLRARAAIATSSLGVKQGRGLCSSQGTERSNRGPVMTYQFRQPEVILQLVLSQRCGVERLIAVSPRASESKYQLGGGGQLPLQTYYPKMSNNFGLQFDCLSTPSHGASFIPVVQTCQVPTELVIQRYVRFVSIKAAQVKQEPGHQSILLNWLVVCLN